MNDFEFFFEQSALEVPILPEIQIQVHYLLHIPLPPFWPTVQYYPQYHNVKKAKRL